MKSARRFRCHAAQDKTKTKRTTKKSISELSSSSSRLPVTRTGRRASFSLSPHIPHSHSNPQSSLPPRLTAVQPQRQQRRPRPLLQPASHPHLSAIRIRIRIRSPPVAAGSTFHPRPFHRQQVDHDDHGHAPSAFQFSHLSSSSSSSSGSHSVPSECNRRRPSLAQPRLLAALCSCFSFFQFGRSIRAIWAPSDKRADRPLPCIAFSQPACCCFLSFPTLKIDTRTSRFQ